MTILKANLDTDAVRRTLDHLVQRARTEHGAAISAVDQLDGALVAALLKVAIARLAEARRLERVDEQLRNAHRHVANSAGLIRSGNGDPDLLLADIERVAAKGSEWF